MLIPIPGPEGGLQQGAQARDEEDGRDQLTFGSVVLFDAQRLSQDKRNCQNATKCQYVMLCDARNGYEELPWMTPGLGSSQTTCYAGRDKIEDR